MSIQDRIAAKMPKTDTATIYGEKVNVRLFSKKQIEEMVALFESQDEDILAKFLANIFTDPETGAPVFTPGFITDEMPQREAMELMKTFKQVNGIGAEAVEDAEKN